MQNQIWPKINLHNMNQGKNNNIFNWDLEINGEQKMKLKKIEMEREK
jgi:hypothetical protein